MSLVGMEGWCGEVGGGFEVKRMVRLMRLVGMEGWCGEVGDDCEVKEW
jgi:hypothetical protein